MLTTFDIGDDYRKVMELRSITNFIQDVILTIVCENKDKVPPNILGGSISWKEIDREPQVSNELNKFNIDRNSIVENIPEFISILDFMILDNKDNKEFQQIVIEEKNNVISSYNIWKTFNIQ